MKIETVTIIGAGPAGLATALQLKRHGVSALLLERACIGGLLHNANLVENYPGFPRGVPGPELVRLFEEQAARAAVEVTFQEVVELTHVDDVFHIKTPTHTYYAHIVVIASGTKPKTFTDFRIPEGLRKRVLYEVLPILEVAGKRIVIVGAGDAAFDYALNLSRKNDVIILNRGERLKCLPLLWERACASRRIVYRENTRVIGVAESAPHGINLECEHAGGIVQIRADYLIGAIGREPQLDFVSDQLLRKSQELENRGKLYFVGDVKNDIYRQTAIAVGQGILTAMKIQEQLL